MLRSELVQRLRGKFSDLTLGDVDSSVKVILEEISNSMANRNRVEISGFATFKANYRYPRASRNPRTGESVNVTEKYIPHF